MPKREPNPNGPIFVPKSFGWGWTLNFKRWESYVILVLLLAFVVVCVTFKNKTTAQ